jgi:diguanylate cyclase (GGDEF)-like protein
MRPWAGDMGKSFKKTALLSWLFSTPNQEVRFDLVRALYSTPKAIAFASVIAVCVLAVAFFDSRDVAYMWALTAFVVIGLVRSGTNVRYQNASHNIADRDDTVRWERMALFGAWSFACLVGMTGAYTTIAHPNGRIELLINSCVMGYLAGISSRNASRPIITIGQVFLTAFPFTLSLLWRWDPIHVVLAVFISILCLSIFIICRSVFDNIVSRRDAFHKINLIARRDALTDLWNRTALIELLDEYLGGLSGAAANFAFILIDLDRFKDINDTFGHQAGDSMLKEVGVRIKSAVQPNDPVARIGGDEFVVITHGADENTALASARRILATFSKPFSIGMSRQHCKASIGYAIAPQDGSTIEQLFRNADLALYEAKQSGRARAIRHSAAISERYDRRVHLEHELLTALQAGQMALAYQPIIDPRSGRAICCEALLRWHHPTLGEISPAEFIPVAETTGQIVSIGEWVLATACEEATRWPNDISLAVNLSAVQFRDPARLVRNIVETLDKTGLSPRRLELEITESLLIEDPSSALNVLESLRDLGVGISLDDFGTGFASLAYLNDFPFSKIKIDRKFSQGIETSPRTAAIIGGIAKTTRDLHIELIAEGIETEAQLESLQRYGIHAMQGFLLCRPLSPDRVLNLITAPIAQGLLKSRIASNVVSIESQKVAS